MEDLFHRELYLCVIRSMIGEIRSGGEMPKQIPVFSLKDLRVRRNRNSSSRPRNHRNHRPEPEVIRAIYGIRTSNTI